MAKEKKNPARRETTFTFKALFDRLNIPPAEQRTVEACLLAGIERYRQGRYHYLSQEGAALLRHPYVFGFGAVEVARCVALPSETRLKVVRAAFAQQRPLKDDGIPHGLPCLLSFMAGVGRLTVPFFQDMMQVADIPGHLYEDWRPEEIDHLLNWLCAKANMPDAERLWWLWYLLVKCEHFEIGRPLLARIAAHPAVPRPLKLDLCRTLLDQNNQVQPPSRWRAVKALLHGDEQGFRVAFADMTEAEQAEWATASAKSGAEAGPEPETDVPVGPPDLSIRLIRTLMAESFYLVPPYLKRAALAALDQIGEDPLALCQAYLHDYHFDTETNAINQGIADIIRAHRESLPEATLRELIERALAIGKVTTRKAFYVLGAECVGPEYYARAAQDNATSIRDWAAQQLSGGAQRPRPSPKGRKL